MINSRSLDDLHPAAKKRAVAFIEAARRAGIDLIVTSTYRDHEAQDALFAQRPRVTKAKGGQSWHNWRCALDVVPVVGGKAVWNNSALWQQIGALGEAAGLEWGGRWTKFVDKPHFQFTGGLTLAELQTGKTMSGVA